MLRLTLVALVLLTAPLSAQQLSASKILDSKSADSTLTAAPMPTAKPSSGYPLVRRRDKFTGEQTLELQGLVSTADFGGGTAPVEVHFSFWRSTARPGLSLSVSANSVGPLLAMASHVYLLVDGHARIAVPVAYDSVNMGSEGLMEFLKGRAVGAAVDALRRAKRIEFRVGSAAVGEFDDEQVAATRKLMNAPVVAAR